jgi:putative phage-type endonuclease
MGLNPWRTAYDVWLRLTGRLEETDEENDAMTIGHMMEDPLLDWAARKEGVKIVKNQVRVHAELPMSAQHDALITGEDRGMEAKTTGSGEEWGEPGSDQVPDAYQIQAQHQMIVSGLREIIMPVAVFDRARRVSLYRLPAHSALQGMIIDRVLRFWECIKTDTPPEGWPSAEVVRRVIRPVGKRVTMPQEAANLVKTYQQQAENETTARKAKEAAKLALAGYLVDAEAGEIEVDGESLLFAAKRIHKKAYTVAEHDEVRFGIQKNKEAV